MRVLLIKTSSMGDIIHTLPALTDAGMALPDIQFDWVVEDAFAEIPHWHKNVSNIIPVALRRWRKGIFSRDTRIEWRHLRNKLYENNYDLILDAQGLIKSAFLTFFTKGLRAGLDFRSARESLASFAYQRKCKVNFRQHAIVRMRSLFSQALGYPLLDTKPNFDLDRDRISTDASGEKYLIFLHGTTWVTKQWPEAYWIQLAQMAERAGMRVKISGGNDAEVERAFRIGKACAAVDVTPRLSISAMAKLLVHAQAVVAVDTGFGHLATALNIPTVSIYGSTNPEYTGALGDSSIHLAAEFPCAPCLSRVCTYKKPADVTPACYGAITPVRVWKEVMNSIKRTA